MLIYWLILMTMINILLIKNILVILLTSFWPHISPEISPKVCFFQNIKENNEWQHLEMNSICLSLFNLSLKCYEVCWNLSKLCLIWWTSFFGLLFIFVIHNIVTTNEFHERRYCQTKWDPLAFPRLNAFEQHVINLIFQKLYILWEFPR